MNFVSKVMFNYDIKKGNVKYSAPFFGIDNLLVALHNSLNAKSFELILTRTVSVIDTHSVQKPVVLGDEKLNLIVADELMYPMNVREFLKQKYNNTFGFENMNFSLNNEYPVYFSGILSREELGPISPTTGDRLTFTHHYIQCRQLTNFDIVVDKNLHQIWPIKTKKTPNVLTDFLAKTKEQIH